MSRNKVLDAYVRIILKHEGGYVNDPQDPGAETYCGISRKHHAGWLGWVDIDDKRHPIKVNTIYPELYDKVYTFYVDNYVNSSLAIGDIAKININLGLQVLDFGINAGLSRSGKLLQRILKATQDGHVGPNTLAALAERNTDYITSEFREGRIAYYRMLATKHAWAKKFLHGWQKRTDECSPMLYESLS